MSGLAAIFERDGAPAAEARIAGMLDRILRRGPDRHAVRRLGQVAVAHCMLATTPEDAIDEQPLASPSGARWIAADARLDNREDLLAALGAREPLSDAAIILAAYERWGTGCPARLLGDFAFVIWDAEARRLFCARDHLGVRQLYYHADARTFRAASEMVALFADDRVPRRPSRRAMALFLTGQYTEAKETLWEGVFALRAGHRLIVTETSIHEEAYWRIDPSRSIVHRDDAAYAEHFHAVFREAVRCRLRADRRMAAEVSGGLDSSSVACEAERIRRAGEVSGEPPLLMRCLYPGLECDEREYSQSVADLLDLPILSVDCTEDREICAPAPDDLDQDYYFDPTERGEARLLALARDRGIRAILTGFAGDYLLRSTGLEGADVLSQGRIADAMRMAGIARNPSSPVAWRALVRDGLMAFAPRALSCVRRMRHPAQAYWPWVSPSIAREALDHRDEIDEQTLALSSDPVRRDLAGEIMNGVNLTLSLALSDRLGARFGVELRHPFVDVRVVELLLAFPHEQRFTADLTKPVLRRAMRGILPEMVRQRRHITYFDSFVRRYLFDEHAGAVRDLLLHGSLDQRGALDRAEIERRLASKSSSAALPLLNPLALELWLRQSDRGQPTSLSTPA